MATKLKHYHYPPGISSIVVSVEESRPRIDTWMTATSDSDFNIENNNNNIDKECSYATPRVSPGSGATYVDSFLFDSNENIDDTNNSSINNENNKTKKKNYYNPIIEFSKSQAALNSAYKQRRTKYNNTPLSARMTTGKNLEDLQPLAVRNAEFC
jgi:hypothetical protein